MKRQRWKPFDAATWIDTPEGMPQRLHLPPMEIHIWVISLECDAEQLAWHRRLLTEDEIRRADTFLFARHQRRFAVGRSCLRQLLANYTGIAPSDLRFDYANLGKPRLAGARLGSGLCFNFSNSHERGLFAITRDVEIGVDIERLRPMDSLEGLADRFFAHSEKHYILGLQEPQQTRSFFECWTRKEAFLKAIGKGLTFPLNDVTMALRPELPVEILQINDPHMLAADWRLAHLEIDPQYVGAVACRRLGDQMSRFRFEPFRSPSPER